MNIKDALKEALSLLNGVEVKGKNNMKRQIIAMERIEAAVTAIENAEKEEEKHEDDHDQQE